MARLSLGATQTQMARFLDSRYITRFTVSIDQKSAGMRSGEYGIWRPLRVITFPLRSYDLILSSTGFLLN